LSGNRAVHKGSGSQHLEETADFRKLQEPPGGFVITARRCTKVARSCLLMNWGKPFGVWEI